MKPNETQSGSWEVWCNGGFHKICQSETEANSLSASLNYEELLKDIFAKEDRLAIRQFGKDLAKLRALRKQAETGVFTKPEESAGYEHS
jgi:hypothetical protein